MNHGVECALTGQRVVERSVRRCERAEVLDALCFEAGANEDERQVAFFLLNGDAWTLAAKGCLSARSEAALARISPEDLSSSLSDRPGGIFDDGWAWHLVSGTGELLGMFVHLSVVPAALTGGQADRVASACHLAALAIEQKNLLDELTWQADHDAVTGLNTRVYFERTL